MVFFSAPVSAASAAVTTAACRFRLHRSTVLKETVALVTGGGSGLGAAAAQALLAYGARVVIADVCDESILDTNFDVSSTVFSSLDSDLNHNHDHQVKILKTSAINQTPSTTTTTTIATGPAVLLCAHSDVTHPEHVKAALDAAERVFGDPVSALVHCAGIALAKKMLSKKGSTVHDLEAFQRVVHINTVGTFNVARLCAERMRMGGDGEGGDGGAGNKCLILTSSIAGCLEGQAGQVAYAASKAAVNGMTLPLARDLAPYHIRVVSIAPGVFATPLLLETLPSNVQETLGQQPPYPQRLGDPAEFGDLVCSIIANPYLNGEVIRLDGALRMPP